MISYRELAMRVVGKPLCTKNTPPPMAHRATALALTAAMVASLAAPAFAGTYYIGDGNITITKTDSGTYVKHSGKNYGSGSLGDKDDGEITIKGGSSKATQELVDESRPVVAMDEDTGDSENDLTYSDPTPVVTWPDVASDEDDTSEEPVDETTDPEEPESTEEQPEAPAEDEENEDDEPAPQPAGGETPENLVSTLEAPDPAVSVSGSRNDDDDSNAVTYESKSFTQKVTDTFAEAAHNIINIINNSSKELNVTLKDVNVKGKNSAALSVSGNGDVTLDLVGENTLAGGFAQAGLARTGSGKLTIKSEKNEDGTYRGSLTATGGNAESGSGGSGIYSPSGSLTISGGTINATGGNGGSGGGSGISAKNLTISGGVIDAIGGDASSEGGTGGTGIYGSRGVTIEGDARIITAQGGKAAGANGTGGAGIRAGDGSDNNVTIRGNATIENAQGGEATGENGTGGAGIKVGNKNEIKIEGAAAVKATAGEGVSNGSAFKQGNSALTLKDVSKNLGEDGYVGAVEANGAGTAVGKKPEGFNGPDVPAPEPEKPDPEPEKPDPEPEKPAPEPEKPAPEPEKPAPEPEKPDPNPELPASETPAPVISSDDSDSTPAPEAVVITPAGVQGFWFTGMLGNSISVKTDVSGSTMEFSSLRYAAALHTTLGQLRQLKEQGITHVTFKTLLCTTTFAIDDLLPLGDDATEVVLSHNGKAATLTVGGVVR